MSSEFYGFSFRSLSVFFSCALSLPPFLVVFSFSFHVISVLSTNHPCDRKSPFPAFARRAANPDCRACGTTSTVESTAPPIATQVLLLSFWAVRILHPDAGDQSISRSRNANRSCRYPPSMQRIETKPTSFKQIIFCKVFFRSFDRTPFHTGFCHVTTKFVDVVRMAFSFFGGSAKAMPNTRSGDQQYLWHAMTDPDTKGEIQCVPVPYDRAWRPSSRTVRRERRGDSLRRLMCQPE